MTARQVTLIRCVGCGAPLGEGVPNEGALAHVRECEKHPMAELVAAARAALKAWPCITDAEIAAYERLERAVGP